MWILFLAEIKKSINVLFCFNSSISMFLILKIFYENNTGYEELMQGGNGCCDVSYKSIIRKITEKCIFKKHIWCHWFDIEEEEDRELGVR